MAILQALPLAILKFGAGAARFSVQHPAPVDVSGQEAARRESYIG